MDNLLVNVRCPYCNQPTISAISGFCRSGLNTRVKSCPSCGIEFSLIFYAEATLVTKFDDHFIDGLKRKIRWTRAQRVQEKATLQAKLHALRN